MGFLISSVLINDWANVAVGVPDLECSRVCLDVMEAAGANVVLSE